MMQYSISLGGAIHWLALSSRTMVASCQGWRDRRLLLSLVRGASRSCDQHLLCQWLM